MATESPNPSKQPPKPDLFGNRGAAGSGRKKVDGPQEENHISAFVKTNLRETVVYVLMLLALLMLFFDAVSSYGSLLIGVLFSVYFIDELTYLIKNSEQLIAQNGMIKMLVLGGTLLALFIKAPFIILGAAAVLAFKLFLLPSK